MKTNRKGGFTLIELLVVIAIIGILSSIVLVSLNSARKKGTDTRVISDVQESRTQLESDFTTVYTDLYIAAANTTTAALSSTVGAGITNLASLSTDAANEGGLVYIEGTSNGNAGTAATPNVIAYAIYGELTSNPSAYFCIDSTGKADQSETSSHTLINCP